MFVDRRPVEAVGLLAARCASGRGVGGGSDSGNHDDQRCGLQGRRNARRRHAVDFVADIQHAGGQATPAGTLYTVVYQLDDASSPPRYSPRRCT
jgi:hypothetical protein